jgi:hypothetical protein
MSEEFREEVKSVVRRHDPSADDLRGLAEDLEQLAERYDRQDEIL